MANAAKPAGLYLVGPGRVRRPAKDSPGIDTLQGQEERKGRRCGLHGWKDGQVFTRYGRRHDGACLLLWHVHIRRSGFLLISVDQ